MNLPIDPLLPQIAAAARRGNLVLEAPPGAGKTTRVPPALLKETSGEILVAQPRRIAARMAASRVAAEMNEAVGDTVGYQVRFDRRAGAKTRILFLTHGLLLRRLQADPGLHGVGAVVLDELHERSLEADLALALLAARGPHVLAMSATMNAAPVAAFLNAETLRTEGACYEVAVQYHTAPPDRPLERRVAAAVRELTSDGLDGDILVFLPGAREIARSAEACAEVAQQRGWTVLPLHGELPSEAQDRAVAPAPHRKLILATNVAETSLTIDGVVAVIDSGLARIAGHSPWSGLPTLRTAQVSQAAAIQRTGRAGRTQPGRCIRLYSQHDFEGRPAHTPPEIVRADLAAAVLQLHMHNVEDVNAFKWFEPPPKASLDAANQLLGRLGALQHGRLTDLGMRMARFPVHPRLARIIVEGERRGVADDAALAAAVLAERDLLPRRSLGERRATDSSGDSDVVARIDSYQEGGRAVDRRAAAAVRRAHRQLGKLAAATGKLTQPPEDALKMALLAGFPDRIARRRRPGGADVTLSGGGSAVLAQDSVVRDATFMLIARAEHHHRGKTIARIASAVEPDWLLDLFPDELTEQTEPVWNANDQRVEVVSQLRYDRLVLDESRRAPNLDEAGVAADLLARAALDLGVEQFVAAEALATLQGRTIFAAGAGAPVEPLTDQRLKDALAAACYGRSSFAELRKAPLMQSLRAALPRALDQVAPEQLELRSGRRVRVHYEQDKPPWIASRLQDFFGMTETPTVAGGRTQVVLHLLAPNQRAVQVTQDLSGFWTNHYPALRKQLGRRYPRHAWPDDPTIPQPGMRPRRKR